MLRVIISCGLHRSKELIYCSYLNFTHTKSCLECGSIVLFTILAFQMIHFYSVISVSDEFTPPKRQLEKPFRCCIGDIFKCRFMCLSLITLNVMFLLAPGSGFNVAGRIDSGHIQVGESVAVLPVGEAATVKSEHYMFQLQLMMYWMPLYRTVLLCPKVFP